MGTKNSNDEITKLRQRLAEFEDQNRNLKNELESIHKQYEKKRIEHENAIERLLIFEKAFDTMQLGVTITETHGKIIYTNPAEAIMHGYTIDELMGQDARIFAPPEYWRPMSVDEIRHIKSLRREGVNLRKNNTRFPVQLLSDAVKNANGEPIGIVTTCEDITNRKLVEKALQQRDAILESMSFAAERILRAGSLGKEVIAEILERLGQAANVSHVYIFENNSGNSDSLLSDQCNVWIDPESRPLIDLNEFKRTLQQVADTKEWKQALSGDQLIRDHFRALSSKEQKILSPLNIKSIVVLPIFVGQKWWGFIGFDECVSEREWSNAEIEALKVAGSLFNALLQNIQAELERFRTERFEGVMEMANAACHELNQPLQAISGLSELLLMQISENHSLYTDVLEMSENVDRIGKITKKINKITKYATRDYIDGIKIIDINEASNDNNECM